MRNIPFQKSSLRAANSNSNFKVFAAALLLSILSLIGELSTAATVYECAPNKVKSNSVVVNILDVKGKLKAEIKSGNKKSIASIPVIETKDGFTSTAKNKKFDLNIGLKRTRNLNIDGYASSLKAEVPGKGSVNTSFICGDRIPKNLITQ